MFLIAIFAHNYSFLGAVIVKSISLSYWILDSKHLSNWIIITSVHINYWFC